MLCPVVAVDGPIGELLLPQLNSLSLSFQFNTKTLHFLSLETMQQWHNGDREKYRGPSKSIQKAFGMIHYFLSLYVYVERQNGFIVCIGFVERESGRENVLQLFFSFSLLTSDFSAATKLESNKYLKLIMKSLKLIKLFSK